MESINAVAFRRYGPADVLEPVTLPLPPLAPGALRVRVAAAGVNPADAALRAGRFRFVMRLPRPAVPGADVAGVVEAVGAGVDGVAPGDAVVAMLPIRTGRAYAEVVDVAAEHAAPAPRTVALADAAGLPLAGLTALQALRDRAQVRPRTELLVHGAGGGVGTLAVQIGRALGARVTAAVAPEGAALAAELGAAAVVERTEAALAGLGPRFDAVLDCTATLPFRRARRLLAPGGVAVLVVPFAAALAPDLLAPLRGGRRARSVLVHPSGPDLRALTAWVDAGVVRPVTAARLPLSEAAEAHRRIETRRTRGKLVLVADPALAALVPGAGGAARAA
jgi:alcohol dehydrogenase